MLMHPYLIGITGGSASGKTNLLHELRQRFPENQLCIVSQDNYYRSKSEQTRDENGYINFDLPSCIDVDHFVSDLEDLKKGHSIIKKEYVFENPEAEAKTIVLNPAPVIVIEGLFIYYFKEISELLHLKIFVDAREDLKLDRRLKRDTRERGIDHDTVIYQWEHHVKPAYNVYLLPFKEESDIIILNNIHFNRSLEVISNHIHTIIAQTVQNGTR